MMPTATPCALPQSGRQQTISPLIFLITTRRMMVTALRRYRIRAIPRLSPILRRRPVSRLAHCSPRHIRSVEQQSNDLETVQLNLTGNLGFATLTSITGYLSQHVYAVNVPNGTFFLTNADQGSHDISEELRFNSKETADHAGGLAWVAGGYFSTGNGDNTFISDVGPPTVQTALPERTEAGFAQLTYGITNRIRATAGIRYTHDEKGVSDIYGSDLEVSDDHVNYRAVIEGDVAAHSLAYLSVSTAYVAGGANAGSTTNPVIPPGTPGIVPPIFQPETITAYEIGSKNTFLDGSLRVNGALYYYQIKELQGYYPGIPNNGALALQIQNIGNEDTYGAEISVAYAPTAADLITFAGTLATATFGEINYGSFGIGPMGPFPVAVSQPPGFPVNNVPLWDVRLGYSHTWDVAALVRRDFGGSRCSRQRQLLGCAWLHVHLRRAEGILND